MNRTNEVIKIGEKIYRILNPESKMDVPSYFYERLEREYDKWVEVDSGISFYDYCLFKIEKERLLKELEECKKLWSKYSCDCLHLEMVELEKRIEVIKY